jgi:hypothetical protein
MALRIDAANGNRHTALALYREHLNGRAGRKQQGPESAKRRTGGASG